MKRVLVVDDEPEIRAVLADALASEDYEVETAGDGAEALRTVAERPPQLVLLDLMMPRIDGWGFLERLDRELGHLRPHVVVLSAAHSLPRDAARLEAQGVNAWLAKPFDLEVLLTLADRYTRPGL